MFDHIPEPEQQIVIQPSADINPKVPKDKKN